MRYPKTLAALLAGTAGTVLAVLGGLVQGQSVHRNGFESREPAWVKGPSDTSFQEKTHQVTDSTAHSGQFSEALQLTTEVGSYIHYFYPLGRAPIAEELGVSLWLKANRPGLQLMARLVLPHERDPNNLDNRLTTMVRGDLYDRVGRWQRLELRRPVQLMHEQQQLMQAQLKRPVDFSDAYLDRLVLNVYGGPGQTEVWIDDVEAGPLLDNGPFQPASRSIAGPGTGTLVPSVRAPSRAAAVEFRNTLRVGGQPFFIRGIRHSDTPLKALRDAGFNTVWMDYATSPELMQEAVNLGFWLVPALPVTAPDSRLASAEGLTQEINRFMPADAVLFWDLGGGLAREQGEQVAAAVQMVRAADPQRPLALDAWDGLPTYSRTVDLVGVHRWPLMTGLELPRYRQWLEQRLLLARPGTFLWTWVQTHLPDWYTSLIYDRSGSLAFDEPIGPQPEQIRLLTYTALSAGCRGLGFWSDRFLADSHQGRDRLLALAILNQEMQLLEPMLVSAEPPRWIDTSNPEVKAAVMRTDRGLLVLPIWLGKGSQYVPGQSATAKLELTVPEVPMGTQVWEVSPAEVRSLHVERVPGGMKVTVPEFSLTAAIVFTGDNNPTGLLVRFQDQVRRMRELAAQWARDQAEVEMEKVAKVEQQLEQAGHTLPDGQALMDDARKRLRTCVDHWNNNDYRQAYAEAERSLRPLRILMRAQWEQAVRSLDSPVASPYAVSFFTLPQHWRFLDDIKHASPGNNLLPGGDFEQPADQPANSWVPQETTLDEVTLEASRITDKPKEGRQCLRLQIKAKDPLRKPAALERTFLALNSPAVRLEPGSLARISGWIRIPGNLEATADGALFYDSAGGEPLAVRLTDATEWKKYTLYRRVPASGLVNVTLALTGIGTVDFDDVRIEPLLQNSTAMRPPVVMGPR